MVVIENECVNCGLPCLYTSCPYYEVEHYLCDRCGEEDTLYEYEGEDLCISCIIDQLTVVEGSK